MCPAAELEPWERWEMGGHCVKLRQFEFLCALKEYGSISRVAKELYTSQPAISISIKEMETELGYPILRRTNRGIQFTEHGEQILEQAEEGAS